MPSLMDRNGVIIKVTFRDFWTHIDIFLGHVELVQALRGAVTGLLQVSFPLIEFVDLGFHHRGGLLQLFPLTLHHKVELKRKRCLFSLITFLQLCVVLWCLSSFSQVCSG